jgi:hypothetical protein
VRRSTELRLDGVPSEVVEVVTLAGLEFDRSAAIDRKFFTPGADSTGSPVGAPWLGAVDSEERVGKADPYELCGRMILLALRAIDEVLDSDAGSVDVCPDIPLSKLCREVEAETGGRDTGKGIGTFSTGL